ncbi:sucrose-6-phosphate hydrolase [Geodermatophilus sabuli]|uniref:Sucrose-6-phosphate hydrolase n=1 Tax=Geodermatophilus sabuli TaxID=1564158 RepID=A0A7K3W202_9ACTN|nr:sucrose-6-phosphate hydrolase [Geodermatophilus sabuli]
MGTATLAAVDLDRTLIYSASAAGDPATLPSLRVVEVYDGAPLSRVTDGAWALLAELMGRATVVPVTTRTEAQYRRVSMPGRPRYALCANGGALLVDGDRDPGWDRWARDVVARAAPLPDVLRLLDAVAGEPWVRTVRAAEGLFVYLVATARDAIPPGWLADLTTAAADAGWTVSLQGRKVYAVPAGLTKAGALLRLREQLAEAGGAPVRLLCAGDSLLDAPMLVAADEAIRPAHGELHEQGWSAGGVAVTAASGALAGEEILRWFLARAG